MNTKRFLTTLLSLTLAAASLSAQAIVQGWQFDDGADTTIHNSTNSGTDGDWSWGTTNPLSEMGQDGTGSMVFKGASTGSGNRTVPTIGTSVYDSGLYDLSYTLTGYDASEGAVASIFLWVYAKDVSGAILFDLKLVENSSAMKLQINHAGGQINHWVDGLDSNGVSAIGAAPTTITASIDFDSNSFVVMVDSAGADNDLTTSALEFKTKDTGIASLELNFRARADFTTPDNFIAIGDLTLTEGTTVVWPTYWGDYQVDELGWIDTGAWMGMLNVDQDPWVWYNDLGSYIYLPEENVLDAGGWFFVHD